jgi:tRNA (guanine-N1)-methyltransferase
VDDKAYGMHGQVISPEPLWKAVEHIFAKAWKKILVIYMTPSGELLQQETLEDYYSEITEKWSEFLIICGHYEWIDQRIIDLYVDREISIWEYVLTSWELAAQVLIDGLIRFVPWVLWNVKSFDEDSFSKTLNRQKEYPVYTRPRIYQDKKVPEILLSGDPKKIEVWKQQHLR